MVTAKFLALVVCVVVVGWVECREYKEDWVIVKPNCIGKGGGAGGGIGGGGGGGVGIGGGI